MGFFNKKKKESALLPDEDDTVDLSVDPEVRAAPVSPAPADEDARDTGSESGEKLPGADAIDTLEEPDFDDGDGGAKTEGTKKKAKDKKDDKDKDAPPERPSLEDMKWTTTAPLLACTVDRTLVTADERTVHVWRDGEDTCSTVAIDKEEKISAVACSRAREVCYIGTQRGCLFELDLTADVLEVKKKMRENRVASKSGAVVRSIVTYTREDDSDALFVLYQDGSLYNVSDSGEVLGVATIGKQEAASLAFCAAERVLYIATGSTDVMRIDAATSVPSPHPLTLPQKVQTVCCLHPKIIVCGDKNGTLYARDMGSANANVAKCNTGLPSVDMLCAGGEHVVVCSAKVGIEVVNPRTGLIRKVPRSDLKVKAVVVDPTDAMLVWCESVKRGVYRVVTIDVMEVLEDGTPVVGGSSRSLQRSRSGASSASPVATKKPLPLSDQTLTNTSFGNDSLTSSPSVRTPAAGLPGAAGTDPHSPSPSSTMGVDKTAWPNMDTMFSHSASAASVRSPISPVPVQVARPQSAVQPTSRPTTPGMDNLAHSAPGTPSAPGTRVASVSLFPPVPRPVSPAPAGAKQQEALHLVTDAFCLLGGTRAVEALASMQTSPQERMRLMELAKEVRALLPGV